VEPGTFLRYLDGELAANDAEAVRAHLESCAECASQLEDSARLETLIGESEAARGTAPGPAPLPADLAIPAELDARLARLVGERLGANRRGFRGWRPLIGGLMAVAATVVAWLGLRTGPLPQAPAIQGAAVFVAPRADVRGAAEPRFHFELTVARPTQLAIFRVAGTQVDILFPHPNPVFGTFGITAPLTPGETVRIPPAPALDYPALETRPEARFFAVPLSEIPTTAALAPALSELRANASDADAVRERLRGRFGSVFELARR
jgi:hypothetical protein